MDCETPRSSQNSGRKLTALKCEKLWPLSAAVLLCGVQWLLWQWLPLSCDSLRELLNATISFASVMGGFVATLMALVFAIRETRPVKNVIQAGLFPVFTEYLLTAVQMCLILIVVCLLSLALIHSGVAKTFLRELATLWVFVTAGALFSTYRVVNIIHSFLRQKSSGTSH